MPRLRLHGSPSVPRGLFVGVGRPPAPDGPLLDLRGEEERAEQEVTPIAAPAAVHVWTGAEDLPGFVPARAPLEAALAGKPMPPEEVRRRSEGWKAEPGMNPGWKIVSTPNVVVHGDVVEEGLMAAGVYAEELHVLLRAALGGPDARFKIRIFQEKGDFRRFSARLGASNAESLYDPRSGEAVFWFGQYSTPELFQRAFAHEFTHAFVDLARGRTEPLWLMEGLAEWFSNLDWRGDILVPDQRNPIALFVLGSEPLIPLGKLLRAGREEIYGRLFPEYYAQAWSLVDYLFARVPGAIEELLAGGRLDAELHEEPWKEYVRETMLG